MGLGDVDGDGHLDVVVAMQNAFEVFRGNGDGTLAALGSTPLEIEPTAMAVADFDGDGRADVAIATAGVSGGATLTIWHSQGDGGFSAGGASYTSSAFTLLQAFSVSTDGGLALFAADSNGGAQVYPVDTQGDLGTPTPTLVPAMANAVAIADFAAPGVPDAVVSAPDQLWLIPHLQDPGTPIDLDGGPQHAIAAGQLRSDAGPDFLTVSYSQNDMAVWLNEGGDKFSPQPAIATEGSGPAFVALGDFSGSGSLDAAVANQNSQDVAMMWNEGDGQFYAQGLYPLQGTPVALISSDLNGDQVADLIILELGCPGQFEVLLSR